GGNDLHALDGAGLALALAAAHRLLEALLLLTEVEAVEELLDRLGPHAAAEVVPEAVPQLAPDDLVVDELAGRQAPEGVPGLLEQGRVALAAGLELLHLALGVLARPVEGGSLLALGLEIGEPVLEVLGILGPLRLGVDADLTDLLAHLGLERGPAAGALGLGDV